MPYCSFYSCYLIRSLKEGHANKVYVGSTPNPQRRIRQHNGDLTQGAYKTRKHRPWQYVMVVYGFPSKIHALQFEWAWQKPLQSRHTKLSKNASSMEKKLLLKNTKYPNLMLTKMWAAQLLLNTMPFCKWPLKLRFVIPTMQALFLENITLPAHITSSVGSMEDLDKEIKEKEAMLLSKYQAFLKNQDALIPCFVCHETIFKCDTISYIECLNCIEMKSHVLCLANLWTDPLDLLPVEGHCPNCNSLQVWGELIRQSQLKSTLVDKDQETSLLLSDNQDSDSSSCSSVINLT